MEIEKYLSAIKKRCSRRKYIDRPIDSKYVKENDIIRPEDLRIKTIANKSKLKLEIIQAIDRKVDLDDLAISKGIEFSELLDEIDAIVFSGTKINIDYYLCGAIGRDLK